MKGRRTRERTAVACALTFVVLLTGCNSAKEPGTQPSTSTTPSSSVTTSSPAPSTTTSTTRPTTSKPATSTPTTSRPATSTPPRTTPPPSTSASPTPPPTTTAPTGRPAALYGKEWTVIPTSRKVVALTFDAGANADGIPKILAALDAAKVPATFFLTGQWTARYPDLAKAVARRGRLANHSYDHPRFTELSNTQIADELRTTAAAITKATGIDPKPWFRFPYGSRDSRTITAVNSNGYVPIGWTVDTLGWEGTSSGITTQRVIDRTLAALQPGEIVLMHCGSNPDDGSTLDADALPKLINTLKSRGYGFVILDALLPN